MGVCRILNCVIPPHLLFGWGGSNVDFAHFGSGSDEQVFQLGDTSPQLNNKTVQTGNFGVPLGQQTLQLLDTQNQRLLLLHQTSTTSKLRLQITDLVLQSYDDRLLLFQNMAWNPVLALVQKTPQLTNGSLALSDDGFHLALLRVPIFEFKFQLLQASTQLCDDPVPLGNHALQIIALSCESPNSFHVDRTIGALDLHGVVHRLATRDRNDITTEELSIAQLPLPLLGRSAGNFLCALGHRSFEKLEKK
mmetsp:Transcript_24488/g.44394  ORF Transcript_24488/g.44394 Transcript_24488/m.44394 type:complete len:249 (-) Transcript_24488:32-778(-)